MLVCKLSPWWVSAGIPPGERPSAMGWQSAMVLAGPAEHHLHGNVPSAYTLSHTRPGTEHISGTRLGQAEGRRCKLQVTDERRMHMGSTFSASPALAATWRGES